MNEGFEISVKSDIKYLNWLFKFIYSVFDNIVLLIVFLAYSQVAGQKWRELHGISRRLHEE